MLPALVMAAALLGLPALAPEAEAARAGKARVEQSHQRRSTAPAKPLAQPVRERRAAPHQARRPASAAAKAVAARLPVPASPAPEIPGARRVVVSALGHAVRTTGIDPSLLLALAWQESRFDPRARNPRSSARGLMQFTEGTWLQAVRDHGPQHGLRYEAAILSTDPTTGAISTRLPRTRVRILELRDNPRYAAALAAERINHARALLEASLGRRMTPADLYMVHLLGPGGAQRFLTGLDRTPSRPAAEFVSADSVGLNREVFTERGSGRPLSLAEVHAWVGRAIAGQRDLHGPVLAAVGTTEVMEVAEAR